MSIPESQLETWASQGATVTAKQTHESIRAALTAERSPVKDRIGTGTVEVYLQGSYRNDTNIRGDSDVDLVVEMTGAHYSNLSEVEKQALGFKAASYTWPQLRVDVIRALELYYGAALVDSTGDKSIKVLPGNGRLRADVVPCFEHRRYQNLQVTAKGMTFWTHRESRQVVNYPRDHYANGTAKNGVAQTNGWFKPVVRIFKNARSYMVQRGDLGVECAPSYFLQCLLYNVPTTAFGSSYQQSYCNVVNYLRNNNHNAFVCQNGHLSLFGTIPEQWSQISAASCLDAFAGLWNNW
jgi:hypothetical protein